MGKRLFDAAFGALGAYNQALCLMAGVVLLAIGGTLIVWFLYDHLMGKRVRGRVAAVLVSARDPNAPKLADDKSGGDPYKDEMYTAVYEYRAVDGSTVRANDGTSSNRLGRKVPGTNVRLYVNRGDPEKVVRAGLVRPILGMVFGIPGFLFVGAAVHSGLSAYTVAIGVCLSVYAVWLINRATQAKEVPETKAQFRARIESKYKDGRELTMEEVRQRIGAPEKAAVFNAPALGAIAIGLVALGVYMGHDTAGLVFGGKRAVGQVVSVESVNHPSEDGDSYTYRPVVAFETPDGERTQFRDRVGSNRPELGEGARVTVLYDPSRPQRAAIDRGVWNWAAPGACVGAGVLLMAAVVRHLRRRRSAAV